MKLNRKSIVSVQLEIPCLEKDLFDLRTIAVSQIFLKRNIRLFLQFLRFLYSFVVYIIIGFRCTIKAMEKAHFYECRKYFSVLAVMKLGDVPTVI